MALTKCPECRKKVSDQCENCPHCGYPIKANLTSDTTDEIIISASDNKKRLLKYTWVWVTIAVFMVAVAITIILLLNREAKPKVDENGNPVFVELNDKIYTNADEYLGYYVNVKGKVFQNLGDNGEVKGVQVWIDPDNCEQNLMIHYTTGGSYKDGDYVICTGYIKDIHTYTNTYGTELSVPLIYSTDLKSASYIEVMAPTVSTITPENLTYEKYGYSITVDKVEYAKSETRLYLTVSNNGNATLYIDVDSSVIVQDGKQLITENNFEANYEEVPYNLSKGSEVSGIVVFPAISNDRFEYVIELHSDNVKEYFETITFNISEESSCVYIPEIEPNTIWNIDNLKYETKEYAITLDKIEFYDKETVVYVTAVNNSNSTIYIDTASSVIVQDGKQFNSTLNYEAEYEEVPYNLNKGAMASGVVVFPAVGDEVFDYVIELRFDNVKEKNKTITFTISEESSSVYVPVVKPTTVWSFDNLKYETKGYAIRIDKIEFYENETLVYVTAMNDGKAALYVDTDGAVIVQNKRQFNENRNHDADYEELPYSIARGAIATGVIAYTAIDAAEFEYTIEIYSDDYNEVFKDIIFTINADAPICKNEENEAWRMNAIINTDPYDNEKNEASISKYAPIYLHFHLLGGKTGEKIKIKVVMIFPDGQKHTNVYDGPYTTNHKETWGWTEGIYRIPKLGSNGTLKFEFYDADTDEKIGETSVQITE